MCLRGINLWAIFHIYQISGTRNAMFRMFGTSPFNTDPQRKIRLSDQEGIRKGRLIWIIGIFGFFLTSRLSPQGLCTCCSSWMLFPQISSRPPHVSLSFPSLKFLGKNSTLLTHILHFPILTYFFHTTYYHETWHICIWFLPSWLGCKHHESGSGCPHCSMPSVWNSSWNVTATELFTEWTNEQASEWMNVPIRQPLRPLP